MNETTKAREFTGRHMLAIMFAFFGVIITVNLTMATLARTSWSGLVVPNTYVASQEFNRKAGEGRAQAALGWTAELSIAGGMLRFALTDAGGEPVRLTGGIATLHRPVGAADDMSVSLVVAGEGAGDGLEAPLAIEDGAWIVEVHVDAGLDRPYRETRRIQLREGAAR